MFRSQGIFVSGNGISPVLRVAVGQLVAGANCTFTDLAGGSAQLDCTIGGILPNGNPSQFATINAALAGIRRDLKVLWVGDSHVQGYIRGVVVSGTEYLGPRSSGSRLDRFWKRTGGYYPVMVAGPTAASGATGDVNAAISDTPGFIPQVSASLRANWGQFLGTIDHLNGGIGGACSYSWCDANAVGYLAVLGVPPDGEQLELGGITYTFRNAPAVPFDILRAANITDQARNIESAINVDANVARYGAGTTPNPQVFSDYIRADQYSNLRAKLVGVAGNAITHTFGASIGWLTPLGGGAAISAMWTNLLATMALGAGFGTPDVICVQLGTNDAVRVGWRGDGMQAHLEHFLDNVIHVAFPSAKVVFVSPPTLTGANEIALSTYVLPAIVAVTSARPGWTTYVDMHQLGAGSSTLGILGADGLHCTNLGYDYMAEAFATGIANAIGLP